MQFNFLGAGERPGRQPPPDDPPRIKGLAMPPTPDPSVLMLLRRSGAAAAVVGLVGHAALALCVLAPDAAIFSYAFGPEVGGRAYKIAHSHVGPKLLAAPALWGATGLAPVACVSLALSGSTACWDMR
jgi:hypothetical protein